MLESHRRLGDAHFSIIKRAHQCISVGLKFWRGQFFRESPQLASTGDGGMIVQVHRMRVVAMRATKADRDDLAGFGVIAKAGRIGHADELKLYQRLRNFQRFGHHRAQRIHIGAISNHQKFAIGETVRPAREFGAG